MTFIEYLHMITGPQWLQNLIPMISLLLAGTILLFFGGFVHGKIILPIADWTRQHTHAKVSGIEKVSRGSNFIANSVATIFLLLYVWFGGFILATYIINPILSNLRNYITISSIIIFLLISYSINTTEFRKKFMGQ